MLDLVSLLIDKHFGNFKDLYRQYLKNPHFQSPSSNKIIRFVLYISGDLICDDRALQVEEAICLHEGTCFCWYSQEFFGFFYSVIW
jgi:hypothetical protein